MPSEVFQDALNRNAVERRKVIVAAALGTMFEWYDFVLYGSLLVIIAGTFFGDFPEQSRNLLAMLAFAAGFVVKPLGALLFGRISDQVGRKYPFLLTIMIMGVSTFLVGLLPGSQTLGMTAAVLLIILRCLQGLALGGESGGAAIFVAEYAPTGKRGFYTSFVQMSAVAGLVLSLVVIKAVEAGLGEEAFADWGWRIPFLVSAVLIVISVAYRVRLAESPVFRSAKEAGALASSPFKEAFMTGYGRVMLVALLGLVAGAAVVTYTGLFYPLFFLHSVLKVDQFTTHTLIIWSLVLGGLGFPAFGWLSDRIGRKPVILGGCVLAGLTFFPIFHSITSLANPELYRAQETTRVEILTDSTQCSVQFNPTGTSVFYQPCDLAKMALTYRSVHYTVVHEPGRDGAAVRIAGGQPISADSPTFARDLTAALRAAGFPDARNSSVVAMSHPFDLMAPRVLELIVVLTVLVLYVSMVFSPIAAALVELFPTRIRYTSMSLPYQLGNGWFGGLLPAIVLAIGAETGNDYSGLWYPVVVAIASAGIGLLLLPETKDRDLTDMAPRPGPVEGDAQA